MHVRFTFFVSSSFFLLSLFACFPFFSPSFFFLPLFFSLFPPPKQRVGRYTRSRHVKRGEITKFHGSVDIRPVNSLFLSFSSLLSRAFTFKRLDFTRSFLIEPVRSVRNPIAIISYAKFRHTYLPRSTLCSCSSFRLSNEIIFVPIAIPTDRVYACDVRDLFDVGIARL